MTGIEDGFFENFSILKKKIHEKGRGQAFHQAGQIMYEQS